MKLIINGVDIFDKVSVRYCVHDMHAADRADALTIRFNDPKGFWSMWQPAAGSVISFEGDTGGRTGRMFIHSTRPENGVYTLRAFSTPTIGAAKASRSWTGVHFFQIANEVAQRIGLEYKNYGCTDQLYRYIAQENETDLAFFSRLCMLEGYQAIVYDGKLVTYDEHYIEQQTPAAAIEIGAGGVFAYQDRSGEAYSSAVISSGSFSGSFTVPGSKTKRILRPADPIKVTSNAEATRFARGILRAANKGLTSGSFCRELMPGYAAASLIRLTTTKAEGWNGTIFLTRVRHDHIRNTTTVFFRRPLEGY